MKNKRRIIGIATAVLLALVGTVSLIAYMSAAKDEAIADEELVDVYIVDEFVPKGADAEVILASVTIEKVPARLEQVGAITELDVIGTDDVAAADLQPGDQLLAARLTARDVVSEEVADKVQVSALLEAHRAVGGALRPGDLVGVYLSFEPFDAAEAPFPSDGPTDPIAIQSATARADDSGLNGDAGPGDENAPAATAKTPNATRLEFQHVLVTNVQTINPPVERADGEEEESGPDVEQVTGTQFVVTVALSPEQSERFVFATEFGSVTLSLDPAGVADDGTRIVTLNDVFEVGQ